MKAIAGTFLLRDSYGLPLSIMMTVAKRRGQRIDLRDFTRSAIRAGWKKEKILRDVREAVTESECRIPTEEELQTLTQL